ncbi:MAG: FprA family A-type flavoprotein [Deltaproteobacteria bacterium]|nr:FprA family A-type flavoprotein [Deltaproteobacteria bacterium]
MAKALIVYATRTGATEKIGDLLAEGVRIAGHEAFVIAVNEIKKETDLEGYDAVVFGSPTYHGDMMQKMKTLLFLAEKVNLEGKIGGAFGAFEWSGEAPGRIFDTMENIFKMDMAAGPLMLKSADLGGGLQMAHEYGKKIAEKM